MTKPKNYREIGIEKLVPFADHPFKLYEGQRFTDMVESIRTNGILAPIVVRPIADSDTYEILSGHNRVAAAKEAGLESVPAVVREGLSDDESMFIVTETNLIQRSFADMKHSERAVVITVHYTAMKKKAGYRSDLFEDIDTLPLIGTRSSTKDKIAEQYGLSKNTIMRYLQVNELSPMLKKRLDDGDFGIYAAVSLSYLCENEQELLNEILGEKGSVGIRQAEQLRKASEECELTSGDIERILNPEKPEKAKPLKIKSEILSEFFNNSESNEYIENTIVNALREYLSKQ